MPEVRPVLVVLDADGSDAALRHGSATAVRTSRPLHLVHVVASTVVDEVDGDLSAAETVLEDGVARGRSLSAGAVPITSELARGDEDECIVEIGESADLIVLQLRSRPDHRPHAERTGMRVTSRARVPVVCVPHDWHGGRGVGTVTVGVEDPETCAPLVREARSAAVSTGARLRVVHVEEWPADAETALQRVREVVAEVAIGQPDVETVVEVVDGRPAAVLRRAATTSELLVVGRHHPQKAGGSRLGSVARAVLRRAVCPVLLPTPSHTVSSAEWVFQTDWA